MFLWLMTVKDHEPNKKIVLGEIAVVLREWFIYHQEMGNMSRNFESILYEAKANS